MCQYEREDWYVGRSRRVDVVHSHVQTAQNLRGRGGELKVKSVAGGVCGKMLDDDIILQVILIGALQLALNALELVDDALLRGRVDHLRTDLGRLRGPEDVEDTVLLGTLMLKLEIINDVAAVGLGQRLAEFIPVGLWRLASRWVRAVDLHLRHVVVDLQHNRTVLTALDDAAEHVHALAVDCDSGGHIGIS